MLKLIQRQQSFVDGYKEYCKEFYDNNILSFRPSNPKNIDDEWYERTFEAYEKWNKENFLDLPSVCIIRLSKMTNSSGNFSCVLN